MSRLSFVNLFLLGAVFLLPLAAYAQVTSCPAGFYLQAGVCFPGTTGLSSQPVILLLMNLMNWLLGILGFIAIIAFIISGLQYLLSAGDEHMAETAKRNMQYSIIGVLVALSGWVIIQAIDAALSGWFFF